MANLAHSDQSEEQPDLSSIIPHLPSLAENWKEVQMQNSITQDNHSRRQYRVEMEKLKTQQMAIDKKAMMERHMFDETQKEKKRNENTTKWLFGAICAAVIGMFVWAGYTGNQSLAIEFLKAIAFLAGGLGLGQIPAVKRRLE